MEPEIADTGLRSAFGYYSYCWSLRSFSLTLETWQEKLYTNEILIDFPADWVLLNWNLSQPKEGMYLEACLADLNRLISRSRTLFYEIFQILSLTMFEKIPLDQLLAKSVMDDVHASSANQLILLNKRWETTEAD